MFDQNEKYNSTIKQWTDFPSGTDGEKENIFYKEVSGVDADCLAKAIDVTCESTEHEASKASWKPNKEAEN